MNTLASRPSAENAARAARARGHALEDAALVRRFRDGDQAAFREIVLRHRDALGHVAFSLLRNRADAEEIVQDTFVRAHRALANFRGESSLNSWLHRIALNLARNRYWYFFRRHRHLTESLEHTPGPTGHLTVGELIASDSPDPARESGTREFSALVTECTARLKAGQQEILHLRNVRELSYRDIARTLGISSGTVKSRVARARECLRRLLLEAYRGSLPTARTESAWFETVRPAAGRIQLAV